MTPTETIGFGAGAGIFSTLLAKALWDWVQMIKNGNKTKQKAKANLEGDKPTKLDTLVSGNAGIKEKIDSIFQKNSDTHNRIGEINGHISCIANELSDQGNQLTRVDTELRTFVKSAIEVNTKILVALDSIPNSLDNIHKALIKNGELIRESK